MPQRAVLYSFRRCPYAIRARMALYSAEQRVEHREVVLKKKPFAMLKASAKGTVPVLVLHNGQVIDESWDIMQWALAKNDPDNLFDPKLKNKIHQLVETNDRFFKPRLDHYKYADRYPEYSMQYHRNQCLFFMDRLENLMQQRYFLISDNPTIADMAVFPFIRQFAFVDKAWFDQTNYPKLQSWLNYWLESDIFIAVMNKYSPWCEN